MTAEYAISGVPVHSGADATKASMYGWNPTLQTFDQSFLPEKDTLVARTDDAVRNSAMLQGGIKSQIDHMLGDHFRMGWNVNPKVLMNELGMSALQAAALIEEAEEVFECDAQSPENFFDVSGRMNMVELLSCGAYGYYRQGEVVQKDEYLGTQRDKGNRPFATAMNLINPDRVMTPPLMMRDDNVKGGFRVTNKGYAFGMYVLNHHPGERSFMYSRRGRGVLDEFAYITRRYPTGRGKWQHIFSVEATDQSRGRSGIVANLKKVRMLDKFEDTMLMNAINRASYAAVIESEDPKTAYQGLHSSVPDLSSGSDAAAEREAMLDVELKARETYYNNENSLMLNDVQIAHTFPNDKLKLMSLDGNVNYLSEYEMAFLRHLARGLGISYEELSGDYSQTNYSGARAGRITSGIGRLALSARLPAKQAGFMFRNWLEEMFSTGRLTSIPGRSSRVRLNHFLNHKEMLCKASFYGPGEPHIDPVKGTVAAQNEMKMGAMTLKKYLNTYSNDSYREVLAQRALELNMAKEMGMDLHEMLGIVKAVEPASNKESE